MTFSQIILDWYAIHQRDLPWRSSRDPYKIWLSEIILQQTRMAQGVPYYDRFLEAFPTVFELAAAQEGQVLKLWQGLGYYSRARNLHATARTIVSRYNGRFPESYEGLKSLKGVGDYTASAIGSICFGLPLPVVDGNVYRVLSRYFGVCLSIDSGPGVRAFKKLAAEVMDPRNVRDYNQGIMEFGAIQCVPQSPDCGNCPLAGGCKALKDDLVDTLPVKKGPARPKARYFNYLVLLDPKGRTLLEERKGPGIWRHLYEFPLIESERILGAGELETRLLSESRLPALDSLSLYNEVPIVHKLSHQHLHTRFWVGITPVGLNKGTPWGALDGFPVPVLIAEFIKTFKI